jgi:hypothetical protein
MLVSWLVICLVPALCVALWSPWISAFVRITRERNRIVRELKSAQISAADCRSFRRQMRQTDVLVETLRAEEQWLP